MHQLSQCLLLRILKFAIAPSRSTPCSIPSARGVDIAAFLVTQESASYGDIEFRWTANEPMKGILLMKQFGLKSVAIVNGICIS